VESFCNLFFFLNFYDAGIAKGESGVHEILF
jgi:hypothetical protein